MDESRRGTCAAGGRGTSEEERILIWKTGNQEKRRRKCGPKGRRDRQDRQECLPHIGRLSMRGLDDTGMSASHWMVANVWASWDKNIYARLGACQCAGWAARNIYPTLEGCHCVGQEGRSGMEDAGGASIGHVPRSFRSAESAALVRTPQRHKDITATVRSAESAVLASPAREGRVRERRHQHRALKARHLSAHRSGIKTSRQRSGALKARYLPARPVRAGYANAATNTER